MNKILRKLKKAYKKIKYLDKTQATFFVVTSFMLMFVTFVGGTYSYFTITERLAATTITIAKLKYELTSANSNFKNNSITVSSGGEVSLELNLKSLNQVDTKYALDYICDNSNVKVYYEEKQEQNVEGVIGGLNSELTIKIYIVNNSSTSQTINLKLNGGYLNNELHSNIIEKKRVIGEMIAHPYSSTTELIWGHKADIKKIVFEDTMNPKENATYTYDISNKQNGSVMGYLVTNSEDSSKYTLYIQSDGELFANQNSSNLFYEFTNLESIENLTSLNTSNVRNMHLMFYKCSSLTTLDVSKFDTSNVTGMSSMFLGCNSLTALDVSKFDTSNVKNMSSMFSGCSKLTALDLSNFNTSNVRDMSSMFSGCSNLTTLNVRNFNIDKVTSKMSMFFLIKSSVTITVKDTTLRDWLIKASLSPKLTISNFVIG